MELVDKHWESPNDRAERVWTVVQLAADQLDEEMTNFDIMCFAIEFLGKMAVGEYAENERFVRNTKELGRWLYNAHYFHAPEIHGPARGDEK